MNADVANVKLRRIRTFKRQKGDGKG